MARFFQLGLSMKLKPLALLLALPPCFASAAEPTVLEEILVTAQRPGFMPFASSQAVPAPVMSDLASALAELPGAAVVKNGPLTGIAQVRGLSGDRVNILIDGMDITPACPNHMDPPLHYAAPADTESLTLIAGASPVSSGGDALGASIQALSLRPAFQTGDAWQAKGKIDAGFSAANDGWNLGLNANTGNRDNALSYAGNFARGDDMKYANGTVKDTGYDSQRNKLAYARATESGRFDASVSQHRVSDAGNPSLPMDMIKDGADAVNLAWDGKLGDTNVTARVYWHDIEHLMDNYSLRPVPVTVPATNRMFAPATSTDTGLVLTGKRNLAGGRAGFGVEWVSNDFSAAQWTAAGAFSSDIMRDASRDRLGVYGEWQGALGGAWSANLGLRSDTVSMKTGRVREGAAQADAVSALGVLFNSADRKRTDHNWDWNALFQYAATPDLGYEIGLTRKTRSPSLLERYEWTPINASAGQADGNSYVGQLGLKPEVAHALNLALQGKLAGHDYRLGAFYQRVSDYIVGTPYTTTGVNNVLRYENHAARLTGLDGSWGYQTGDWNFSGVLSYVLGRNLDSNTPLYRIAPLRLTLQASHQAGAWHNTLAARMARRQDDVASYVNVGSSPTQKLSNEKATPGYAVFDWHTQWRATKGVKVNFGIDNLLDKLYYDHLGGINRINCAGVPGCVSDVALNARLPSAGRFAFAQLEWTL
jgi:iron complex outermembrane receptor protein